ncbi:hypothetical protein DYB30_007055 [Aphanomyces astaci]|uniref:Phospho-2-dehydro-3-deoxyheptonate aldolase n=1 Tax=Aphanomyces astaci TaxID=112090 RepID=A0A397BF49_APHAT|nr:hypothetical protein DYB36_009947 [Aphanomyces astaci]RHY68730.1 hypothetical protein DYB30_007055 [Aphanomyces astaci]
MYLHDVPVVKGLPPLVSVQEVDRLRLQLAEVAEGKRFVLQGGDCAESFSDCQSDIIEKKLRIMMQMSLVLVWGARMPTTRVARMAGQFSKPRSQATEVIDGDEVCTFRGENVNGFHKNERTPDPNRLLEGYFHSAATLNYGRLLLDNGFADIHDAAKWELGFVQNSVRREEYSHMVEAIQDSLQFVHTCGVGADNSLKTMDLFVSHEGLGLGYEEAMTREVNGQYYNLGTDFLWIGDRTRQLDHAHVEYFRGIANPIGVKVGPSTPPNDLVELVRTLWPHPELTPGKITLITRYGDDKILSEVQQTVMIHQRMGSYLGGVHIELTGENVTECTGGPEGLSAANLPERYTTMCDPRLNYSQSMEVAFLLSKYLKNQHKKPQETK